MMGDNMDNQVGDGDWPSHRSRPSIGCGLVWDERVKGPVGVMVMDTALRFWSEWALQDNYTQTPYIDQTILKLLKETLR